MKPCIAVKPLLVCNSDRILYEYPRPGSDLQEDPEFTRCVCWYSNKDFEIRPSQKLSQPKASISCPRGWSMDALLKKDPSVMVPCPLKIWAKLDTKVLSMPVCCIQVHSVLIRSRKIFMLPASRYHVMWDVDSFACPQHGHELSMLVSRPERCLFVPQKCETCFVTHTWNICQCEVMASPKPSQLMVSNKCADVLLCLIRTHLPSCYHQCLYMAAFIDPVTFTLFFHNHMCSDGNFEGAKRPVMTERTRQSFASQSAMMFSCCGSVRVDQQRSLSWWSYTCTSKTRQEILARFVSIALMISGCAWDSLSDQDKLFPCITTPMLLHAIMSGCWIGPTINSAALIMRDKKGAR